ncbi:hypothetical protein [Actinomadura rudentiformis]|uniref:hypothetical protein n=1 Tax=Actinomadura rudentiformis TaxID=359158 RepID=UPI00178C3C12|nr:hypothetical protein [Actinomadura rudentiformis]
MNRATIELSVVIPVYNEAEAERLLGGFVSLKRPGVTEDRARHVAESVLPAA